MSAAYDDSFDRVNFAVLVGAAAVVVLAIIAGLVHYDHVQRDVQKACIAAGHSWTDDDECVAPGIAP